MHYECDDDLEEYHYKRLGDVASLVLKGVEWSSEVLPEASDARALIFESVASFEKWLK